MTTLTERHDAQHALTRPTTIQDLGRRITAESRAMRALLDVAENEFDQVCQACGQHDEYGVAWPCPTAKALDRIGGAS